MVAIAEWLAVLLLAWLCIHVNAVPLGSKSPEQAHRLSESSYHYGPSEIVRKVTVPFDQHRVVFLATYKDWFSANTVVKKKAGWVPGGGVGGIEIDREKPLSYSWGGTSIDRDGRMMFKFYGYVSDSDIATVELLMTDRESGKPLTMREPISADRMFLFLWESKGNNREMKAIRGLDVNGSIRYEFKLG